MALLIILTLQKSKTAPRGPVGHRVHVGAGRTELLTTLFGVEPPLAGTIRVRGRELAARTPKDAIRAGLALVPEDRKERGLLLDWGLRDNVALPQPITQPSSAAVAGALDHLGPRPGAHIEPEPVAVAPGSLGHFFDDEADDR